MVANEAAGPAVPENRAGTDGPAAVVRRTAAGDPPVRRAAVTRTAAPERTAKAAPVAGKPAEQTGAKTVVAKNTPGGGTAAAGPEELAVRSGEEPWTPEEVSEARGELHAEVERLRAEIAASQEAIAGLMRDSGDGAGDDQADTGTKNITREHEMALNANAREMLDQTERALERLDAGTYGLCESCGEAIGKARMQAFPRATLCVECKQRQERR
ncbi:TraR/DksA family transcriptional regulator [Streptomyces zingiberis]|uniref:DNA-binding protein n=1 Tax=Streptomyces zingiberis TaxID=2053010 RepID=A0ABX1C0Y1_9ACTN|nr:TraR/DksA C4-type zinc finger protein [Streptomyces zingiberis]NJQ02411.1 DNA-binding protein [Streptomyces zingiberis]